MTEEVRTVSATGGEKGRKTAELASIDPLALLTLAEVSGFGARKYASFNYLRGYDWTLSANAALRHLLAFLNGEDNDPESGLPHTAHFAWHGLALTSFLLRELGTDDRYKQPEAEPAEAVLDGDACDLSTASIFNPGVGKVYMINDAGEAAPILGLTRLSFERRAD